ncbi:hypothetical protein B9Y63_04395 [Stenotrophomonas maltophilia]|nr:hypothetical protein B9Y63_04395 [Stenotrophomonas maltophilia]
MYWLEIFNHEGLSSRLENLEEGQLQPLFCLFLSTELGWQYGIMESEHVLGGCLLAASDPQNGHILSLESPDSDVSAPLPQ